MGTAPGWGLEHRASNPVSVKNLAAIETATIVKLLRPYVPVGNQKFPDWPPGARTANGTALCHWVQLYRYFVN
jgi:hypothetical protein